MLCAALKRRTGEDLFAYLTPRLFEPLGISDVECFRLPDGVEMGGAGSRLRTEDMARFILFAAQRGRWADRQLLDPAWFELATSKAVETLSPVNDPDTPDWRCGYGFQFWRCVPEHVVRADGAFGQYGVIFEEKDTILILQSASARQQDQLTCAWETILPAITDEASLPESPVAHVLRHRLERAEIQPMLSMRNRAAEMQAGGKRFVPEKAMPGLADLIGGIWIVTPQGGKTQALRLDFSDDKAVLTAEQDNGVFSVDIGLESHFAMSALCGRTYGAVGRWRTDTCFEAEIRCAESVGGKRMLFGFDGGSLTLHCASTLPLSGGIAEKGPAAYALSAE